MFDNTIYNLMEQAVEESQSLWRIKTHYIEDAKDCDECREYWEQLKNDKEQHCEDLWNLIQSHMTSKKEQYYEKKEKKLA